MYRPRLVVVVAGRGRATRILTFYGLRHVTPGALRRPTLVTIYWSAQYYLFTTTVAHGVLVEVHRSTQRINRCVLFRFREINLEVALSRLLTISCRSRTSTATINNRAATKYLSSLLIELVERVDQTKQSSCWHLRPGSPC